MHSLVDGTYEEALDAMARRSVEIQHGAPRIEKEAMDKTAMLESMGNWYKGLAPEQQKALMGAGVGGALGVGSSFLRDEEDRNTLGSGLTGALAGGAAGLGLGLASKHAPKAPVGPPVNQIEYNGKKYTIPANMPAEQRAALREAIQKGKGSWAGNAASDVLSKTFGMATTPEAVLGGFGSGALAYAKEPGIQQSHGLADLREGITQNMSEGKNVLSSPQIKELTKAQSTGTFDALLKRIFGGEHTAVTQAPGKTPSTFFPQATPPTPKMKPSGGGYTSQLVKQLREQGKTARPLRGKAGLALRILGYSAPMLISMFGGDVTRAQLAQRDAKQILEQYAKPVE